MNLKDYIQRKCLTSKNTLNVKSLKQIEEQILSESVTWAKTLPERCFCIVYNVMTRPVCSECCINFVSFQSFTKGYKKYCSLKCSNSSVEVKNKKKRTALERYGVENPSKSFKIKEKIKETNLERYGVENPSKNAEIKEKIREVHISKSSDQKKLINVKRKETCINRYGVEYITQFDEFKKRKEQTCIDRYAVKYAFVDKEKVRATNLKKYGVENPSKSFKIKEKIKETNLKKYGVENPSKNLTVVAKANETKKKNYFLSIPERVDHKVSPMFEMNDYCSNKDLYQWKCNECGFLFFDKLINGKIPICRKCNPYIVGKSKQEEIIANWLQSLGFVVERNRKDIIRPKEIDMYLPEESVAIEYCGLYWHSDFKLSNDYHFLKYKKCQELGIRLITIFEDEWRNKQEICKSRILYILKKKEKICGARETTLRVINNNEYNLFLLKYHIQGPAPSKVRIGAFFANELVAVMGFSKLRKSLGMKNRENCFEMVRYASAGNIPGIASKMLSHFLKNNRPKEIISYCDLRWGTGKLYEDMGFVFNAITKPNYWYVKLGTVLGREHRFKYRKDVLVKKGFDKNLTEEQIMKNNGYCRIYDCGNAKFVWRPV